MGRPFGVKPRQLQITAPVTAGAGWIDSSTGLIRVVDPTRRVFISDLPDSDNWGGRLFITGTSGMRPLSIQNTATGTSSIAVFETAEGGHYDIGFSNGHWFFGDFQRYDPLPGIAEYQPQEAFRSVDGSFSFEGTVRHRVPTGQGRLDYKVGGSGVTSLLVLSGFRMQGVSLQWHYDRTNLPLPYRQWIYRGYGKFTRNAGDIKIQSTLEADTTQELINCVHTPTGNTAYFVEIILTLQGETGWTSDGTYAEITSVKFDWVARVFFATDTTTAQPVTMYMQRGKKTGFQQHDTDIDLYVRGGFNTADSANLLEKFADSMHFT